jgi:flagellar motor switch/type III secretory pathway protein FliN
MSTSPQISETGSNLLRGDAGSNAAIEMGNRDALVPVVAVQGHVGMLAQKPQFAQLPVELDVAISVKEFRVCNLLALAVGQVIETEWAQGDDLPLAAGAAQLAWSEFEVVDAQLAVRITRLA